MNNSNTTLNIAFIGAGNMASSLVGGLIAQGYNPENIYVSDLNEAQLNAMSTQYKVNTSTDNQAICAEANVIVFAVKPQVMKVVAAPLQEVVRDKKPLIISIAAGISSNNLSNWLGADTAIVRCMPNTPALVQTGATGLFANAQVNTQQRQTADDILKAVGITAWVKEEHLIDAVTAVSGSGPAYFFMVMEAMITAGEKLGLPAELAQQLTLQTALGAAKMASSSDIDVSELRRRVTSPGGTTEAALNSFTASDINGIFEQALTAAADKAKQLEAKD